MRTKTLFFALAAGTLLAGLAGAQVSAVSDDAPLDTRSLSVTAAEAEQILDTRTHTVDWSEARTLNTKKIVGTMILVR
jgi:hypothetical protein